MFIIFLNWILYNIFHVEEYYFNFQNFFLEPVFASFAPFFFLTCSIIYRSFTRNILSWSNLYFKCNHFCLFCPQNPESRIHLHSIFSVLQQKCCHFFIPLLCEAREKYKNQHNWCGSVTFLPGPPLPFFFSPPFQPLP